MQKHESMVIGASIGFLVYSLLLSALGPVVSTLQTNRTFGNTGSVKAIGVGVYWDQSCTNTVQSFNWGMIEPNSTQSLVCYVRNEGDQIVTLTMYTSNWNPASAAQYITLSWNLQNATLNVGQVRTATFTLAVSASVQGITSFSFDTTIIGSS
jgi:hypothetical protein